ncbi:MAG: S-methyl-5-thioribose-1-phosphate isomerase [bacterium]|nr:S-methyl-5-thioribose-1-phosphate isomerase [bacterium]
MYNLKFSTISWDKGKVKILDQTLLPAKVYYQNIQTHLGIADAIQNLKIRGAPLIGVAAAYGVALAAYNSKAKNYQKFKKDVKASIDILKSTRPTGYNLFSTLKRMTQLLNDSPTQQVNELKSLILQEAHLIKKEDEEICQKIGENGLHLIINGAHILTHCNAGALATAGIGTALAPVYLAKRDGKKPKVFVTETRPVLQGARLTAWELLQAEIEVTLICDSAKGALFKNKKVDICIVGADRIAKNGDVANKIGTYTLAVIAKMHNVPFYVAAPISSFDNTILSGAQIPIEERSPDEVRKIGNFEIAPRGVEVFNPAFDVTPHEYITGYITENGIQKPPFN